MNRIPAQVAWPAAVVGLILLGMTSTFGVLVASRSDGGPGVIKNYYQQAVAWDSSAAVRQASKDLGWRMEVTRVVRDGRTELELQVIDRDGQPVSGLRGELRLSRPQTVGVLERLPLVSSVPSVATPLIAYPTVSGRGLWDIEVDVSRGDDRYVGSVRREWPLP